MRKAMRKAGKQLVVLLMICCLMSGTIQISRAKKLPHGWEGPHVKWQYNPATKTLTLSGKGRMTNAQEMEIADICYEDPYHHPDYERYRNQIKKVVFGEGITDAGYGCFFGMGNLTEVRFSNSVKAIREEAFMYCSKLKKVTLPPHLKKIERAAFAYTNIKEIKLPEGIKEVQEDAFEYSGLKKINIPKSLKELPATIYAGKKWMKSYKLPKYTESIGHGAFLSCRNLKSITLNKKLKKVGASAFSNCKNLTSIKLPSRLEEIGEWAFDSCSFTTVTIPKQVKIMKKGIFTDCKSLEKAIILSDKITTLEQTFQGCKKLKEVMLPKKLNNLGEYTFYECQSLKSVEIPDTVKTLGEDVFLDCSMLKTIKLPDKLEVVQSYAFENSGIESITIPSEVYRIGSEVFKDCKNLKEIHIKSDKIQWVGERVFDGIPSDCVIYVPVSKVEQYRYIFRYRFGGLDPAIQIIGE